LETDEEENDQEAPADDEDAETEGGEPEAEKGVDPEEALLQQTGKRRRAQLMTGPVGWLCRAGSTNGPLAAASTRWKVKPRSLPAGLFRLARPAGGLADGVLALTHGVITSFRVPHVRTARAYAKPASR
jgi:hypothetical protein